MTTAQVSSRKEDIIAALEHRQPTGAVPIWELEFHAWDAATGRHMVLGHEFEKLSAKEQERALHENAEIILTVAQEMHWSAVTVPTGFWNSAPGQLAYYCLPQDARFRQTEILAEMADDLLLISSESAILGANYSEDFCEKMFDEPEAIDAIAKWCFENGVESARRFRDCGVGATFSASDVADNNGPFFKPDQMVRWVYPYMGRWDAELRSLGLHSIFHSDGNLKAYVEAITATGISAWQAIDPIAGMDIVATKKQLGSRLCLCGNVDCGRLLLGTPEEIFEKTKDLLLACKPGGCFSLGASNAVQAEVPLENYRAMIEAWKQHGTY